MIKWVLNLLKCNAIEFTYGCDYCGRLVKICFITTLVKWNCYWGNHPATNTRVASGRPALNVIFCIHPANAYLILWLASYGIM